MPDLKASNQTDKRLHPIQKRLQNERRRAGVQLLFSFFAAHVIGVNHDAFNGGGGIAFVLEINGLLKIIRDFSRLFQRVFRLRSDLTVRLQGQTGNESADVAPFYQFFQFVKVVSKAFAKYGF